MKSKSKHSITKGLFLDGIVSKNGLVKHLNETVILGNHEDEINDLMFDKKGPAQRGFLRSLDNNFYIQICVIKGWDKEKGYVYQEIQKRRLVKNGDVIRFWQNYKGAGRNYEVNLK